MHEPTARATRAARAIARLANRGASESTIELYAEDIDSETGLPELLKALNVFAEIANRFKDDAFLKLVIPGQDDYILHTDDFYAARHAYTGGSDA